MKRYFAAIISAVAAAALCLAGALVPGLAAAAQAAELAVENKVYRRIEGVNARGPNLAVLSTQSLELTVSIDVPSGRFAYLGFNNSDRGAGAPAAGATAGIGLLMYNSNNVCMAFEVYRNDNWAQLTETLEIGSIRPGDTVTVSIRNVNGARGVYIDGELLTERRRGGRDDCGRYDQSAGLHRRKRLFRKRKNVCGMGSLGRRRAGYRVCTDGYGIARRARQGRGENTRLRHRSGV